MYNRLENEIRFIIKYKSGIIAYKDKYSYLSLPSSQEINICNNTDLMSKDKPIFEYFNTESFISKSIDEILNEFTNVRKELKIDELRFKHSSNFSFGFSRHENGINKYINISLCSIDLSGLIDFDYIEKRLLNSRLIYCSQKEFINNLRLQEEMNIIPEHEHSLFKLENYLKSYQKELNEYLINNSLDIV